MPAAAGAAPLDRDGLVIVDKPIDWTSHDVVARLRKITGIRKIGHAGTLDPMATGVLVCGVGGATRLLGRLALAEKSYQATVRLGVSTTTDDARGEVTGRADAEPLGPDLAGLRAAMAELTGNIEQVPSSVSAIKVAGKRAYQRVRDGETVTLPARGVVVSQFRLDRVTTVPGDPPALDLDVEVTCSSGTYVRALARDLGASLGVGGHLTALRRTRVGPFDLASAHTLPELEREPALLPLGDVAGAMFPRADVAQDAAGRIAHGNPVELPALPQAPIPEGQTVSVFGPGGLVLALAEVRGGMLVPVVVWA